MFVVLKIKIWKGPYTYDVSMLQDFCHVPYVCFLGHLLHPSHPFRTSFVNVPSPMLERHSLETGTPIWPPPACQHPAWRAWPLTWHLPIPSHITGHWELIGRESNRHFPLRLLSLKDLDEILSTCERAFSTLGVESKRGQEPYWLSTKRVFAKIYQNQILILWQRVEDSYYDLLTWQIL